MYQAPPTDRDAGGVGVTDVVALLTPKRPRGRPRKVRPTEEPFAVQPPPADPTHDLIALIRELSQQQQRVLEQVVASQTATTDMMKTWLQMFVPSPTPLASTSEDVRAKLREEREIAEWGPLPETLLHEVLRNLP